MIKYCSGYHAHKETLKTLSLVIVIFDLFGKSLSMCLFIFGCRSGKIVLIYGGSVVHIFSLVSVRYSRWLGV